MIEPDAFFGVLGDTTRLRALMLIHAEGEVCVCELTYALEESQPKISRHLAYMREAGVVTARREGTWMHYRLSRRLPQWSRELIGATYGSLNEKRPFIDDRNRLLQMNDRPDRRCA